MKRVHNSPVSFNLLISVHAINHSRRAKSGGYSRATLGSLLIVSFLNFLSLILLPKVTYRTFFFVRSIIHVSSSMKAEQCGAHTTRVSPCFWPRWWRWRHEAGLLFLMQQHLEYHGRLYDRMTVHAAGLGHLGPYQFSRSTFTPVRLIIPTVSLYLHMCELRGQCTIGILF